MVAYAKNCKMLRKQHKDKWRDTLCSWIAKLNLLKMLIFPKLIYRFILIKIPIKILPL